MNFSDSEIVASILEAGFATTRDEEEADLILLNTCAIRENAEQRVRTACGSSKKRSNTGRNWWWVFSDAWQNA